MLCLCRVVVAQVMGTKGVFPRTSSGKDGSVQKDTTGPLTHLVTVCKVGQ